MFDNWQEELQELIEHQCVDTLTDAEAARLEQLVCGNEDACRFYCEYTSLLGILFLEHAEDESPESILAAKVTSRTNDQALPRQDSNILGFLGDIFQSGANTMGRPFVMTLLFTIGIPGIILTLLWIQLGFERGAGVAVHPEATSRHVMSQVAKVGQIHQCIWDNSTQGVSEGDSLTAGQQLRLRQGLVELDFADGTSVIIEGPATFDTQSAQQGFLHIGKLIAKVPKGAEGFTIVTPSAKIVDLGTEFGVSVLDNGTAEAYVFKGEVSVAVEPNSSAQASSQRKVQAGEAVRMILANRKETPPIIQSIAATTNTFVRQMPRSVPGRPRLPDASNMVVADFSGGEGTSQVNQFPGTAGAGWANRWQILEDESLRRSTTIEQANPILGGGKYLRMLAEWKPGAPANLAEVDIERRLALNDRVDLRLPYIVSINLRVDALDRFIEPGDRLTICSRRPRQVEGKREGIKSSGWHISATGQDPKFGNTKNWVFFGRDKENKSQPVDSGILIQEGNTYSFRVLVNPEMAQWTPSIAVNGGEWTEFETMGMQSRGTAEQNDYWPILYFYCRMRDGNKEEGSKRIGFSVDSISIVPK